MKQKQILQPFCLRLVVLIITPDGSLNRECKRGRLGICWFDGRKIAVEWDSCTEVAAVNRALKGLSLHHPNHAAVIIAMVL